MERDSKVTFQKMSSQKAKRNNWQKDGIYALPPIKTLKTEICATKISRD